MPNCNKVLATNILRVYVPIKENKVDNVNVLATNREIKKPLAVVLAVVMLLAAVPIMVLASDEEYKNDVSYLTQYISENISEDEIIHKAM